MQPLPSILPVRRAFLNKGLALTNLKKFGEAVTAFDSAIRLDPAAYDAWFSKGCAHSRIKQYDDAVAAFDRALEIDPTRYPAYHEKGVALARLDRYEDAVTAFSDAIALETVRNRRRIMRKALLFSRSGAMRMLLPHLGGFLSWTSRFWMLPIRLALQRNALAGLPKR